jgi:hypothetical protein
MRKGPQGQRIGKGLPDRGACDQANIPDGSIEGLMAPRLKTRGFLLLNRSAGTQAHRMMVPLSAGNLKIGIT